MLVTIGDLSQGGAEQGISNGAQGKRWKLVLLI